ncbi:hypothetical protein MMC25_004520 [Agyrium rufum]|nr:hypothetical protein [Agyrium rufum]
MSSTASKPNGPSSSTTGSTPRRGAGSSSPAPRTNQSAVNSNASTSVIESLSGVKRPVRASVRRAPTSTSNGTATRPVDSNEEDAKAEQVALVDDLRQSLHKAELASEDYQGQLESLQSRLDESQNEHTKFEEQIQESRGRIEQLELEAKTWTRQKREMEMIHESEKAKMLKDREEQAMQEKDMKVSIQRLKETLASREMRLNDGEKRMSSVPSSETANSGFAPSGTISPRESSLDQGESKSKSQLLMQKDMLIESLRLELAEAQIKQVEMENMGGGRMQDLERTLLETRMTNARLMEDNESFQLLLSEKTLNGDITKVDFMQGSTGGGSGPGGLGSLAEELESAEGESENYRRLETEARSLRDQNKALTLYVEKIISRVLQHDNFETILDQKPEKVMAPPSKPAPVAKSLPPDTSKDLPPAPTRDLLEDEKPAPSALARAMSVVSGRRPRPASQIITPTQHSVAMAGGASSNNNPTPPWESLTTRKTRPMSQVFAPTPEAHHQQHALQREPNPNEDPFTAPSIPLGGHSQSVKRGHRRTQSEQSDHTTTGAPNPGAALVVNSMYRGPSPGIGAQSPTLTSPGGTTPRTSYFGAPSLFRGASAESHPSLPIAASVSAAAPSTSIPTSSFSSSTTTNPTTSRSTSLSTRTATSAQPSASGTSSFSTNPDYATSTSSDSNENEPGYSALNSNNINSASNSAPSIRQSPPRNAAGNTQYTGAVMKQNQLRPLRLVQEKNETDHAIAAGILRRGGGGVNEEEAARKKANRGSWMGWFNRGAAEGGGGPAGSGGTVLE